VLIAHSEPCSHCGQIVEFTPAEVVHHNGAPRKLCKGCGNYTELSFLLNLVSALLGFVAAGYGFVAVLHFIESMVGTPVHIAWFLALLVFCIFAAVFTSIAFSTICYFMYSRLQR
jgi:hypothetical protein